MARTCDVCGIDEEDSRYDFESHIELGADVCQVCVDQYERGEIDQSGEEIGKEGR